MVRFSIFLILVVLISSCKQDKIDILGNLDTSGIEMKQVNNVKEFTENIIDSYQKIIFKKQISKKYQNDFVFFDSKYRIDAILSSDREIVLSLSSSKTKEFRIYPTSLPATLVYMTGLENNPSDIERLYGNKIVEKYRNSPPQFNIDDPTVELLFIRGGGTLSNSNTPIVKDLFKPILILHEGIVDFIPQVGNKMNKRELSGFVLISGGKEFSYTKKLSSQIAEGLVENEIKNLIVKDSFFLLSLAHPTLRPLAENIQYKLSKSKLDSSFEYPIWEFKKDVYEMESKAMEFGIHGTYAKELLEDEQYKPKDGHAFFYYANQLEFLSQWNRFNFILLLIASILIYYKNRFNNFNFVLILILFLVTLIAGNWLMLDSKNDRIPLIAGAFPFFLFLINLLIVTLILCRGLLGNRKENIQKPLPINNINIDNSNVILGDNGNITVNNPKETDNSDKE